ncbi:acyl-homoserine-lactone synthase [Mesorhizobium sp. M0615]|uniref:acyl-homoserine-lactone synthase n=1 Tax=Mesorhizobium sp. M0615 TaxID=2956971 RepID=UPI00333BD733
MHRLRHHVFRDRLNWDVSVSSCYEVDPFDALHPHYRLLRAPAGRRRTAVPDHLTDDVARQFLRSACGWLGAGRSAGLGKQPFCA